MDFGESDDEIPFIARWECCQSFEISIVHARVIRFGAVGGTRYIFTVLCG